MVMQIVLLVLHHQRHHYHYAPNINQVYLYGGGPYWCNNELGVFCDAYSVVDYAWHYESSLHQLLINYHRLAYATTSNGLDIVIGQPSYEGTDYGFPITIGGIFYINCWESHEQHDVGSPI